MDWSEEEEKRLTGRVRASVGCFITTSEVLAVASLAVELAAARGGTKAPTEEEVVASVQNLSLNEGCKVWVAEARRARLEERRLGARVAVLEADLNTSAAEVGRLTGELTKARAAIAELNEHSAKGERMATGRERELVRQIRNLSATVARLTAAAQALSEHADRTAGEPT